MKMLHQLRSCLMVLAFIVGGLFHGTICQFLWFLPIGIAVMLSITFIGIDTKKLKPTWKHLAVLLGIQCIGLGAWAIARAMGQPVLAESLYYCGAAPVAAAIPVIVSLLKGNMEFTVTAMVLSHAVFAALTPFVLPFVVHAPEMDYAEFAGIVARQLSTVLAAPAIIALVLRLCYPPCKAWSAKLKDVSLGFWITNLTIISASGTQRILQMNYSLHDMWPMAVGAVIICAIGFVGGYWLGYPQLKRECSQALGQKNTVLTLYIAGQSYATPLAYIGPVFYVFCHNTANAIQLFLAERETERKQGHGGLSKASARLQNSR